MGDRDLEEKDRDQKEEGIVYETVRVTDEDQKKEAILRSETPTIMAGATQRETVDTMQNRKRLRRNKEDASRKWEDASRKWEDTKRNLADAMRNLADTVENSPDAMRNLADAMRNLADGMRNLADASRKWEDPRLNLKDAMRNLADAMRNLADASPKWEDAKRNFADASRKWEDAMPNLADASRKWEDAKRNFADASPKWEDAKRNFADASRKWEDAKRNFADAMRNLADASRKWEDPRLNLKDAMRNLADAMRNLADAVGDSPEEKLTNAKLKQEIREQAVQLREEKLTSAKLKQEIREQAVQLQSYQEREACSLPRYKMEKRPRGRCIIINNVNFEDLAEREGAEFDEKALKQLFIDLSFTVRVFKDLQRNQMLSVAASFANKDHSNFDAFIFIVMSHGGNGDTIYGVRGRSARVEDLMSEFKAANCPTLRNKPKLFFIQTCRGSLNETLSPVLGDADVNSAPAFAGDSTLPRGVCPQEADFLLAFATAPGYKAWRIPQTGSPFIQTLVEAIREHHNNHHLLDILTEVNRRVVAREENQRVPVQVPAPTHTLRRQLYL